jgi:type II secretory ATPase GspE/PulE/Tfp pilus assembly ATPase PilB-like protein
MIGEIRDQATAKVAADAAVAGRVLLSTIHARDVVSAVTTLRNRGLGDHEIATALTAVVNQRLVRKLCPACCRKDTPTAIEVEWFKNIGHEAPENIWRAEGCDDCADLGYIGRTGIYEVWHLEEEDLALILRHADEHHLRTHLAGKEHRSLANNAIEKVAHGITTIDELRALTGLLPGGALRDDGGLDIIPRKSDTEADTDAAESLNVAV